ncbi:hypothetical protein C0Q70_18437 [Pomacea canaliculata]|uniref:Ig-like domain-containing protein n=1 Tax=Pomacea canaliculata TaxID=400727 RepID=A0A2T7NN63_POMCA|nr:hypothetical protein C0Q70_18437 [Pomacea canaliculata]
MQDSLVCNTARGYEFEHHVADHVTFKIPSPSENHEGNYSCHMKEDEFVRGEPCSSIILRETNSSCNVPSVYEDHPSTLTCTFSADVNMDKSNVQVVHTNGDGIEDAIILTCTWPNDQLDCSIAEGYEFNYILSDHLVITILRASRDHNGHYACHVLGSELQGFKQCPFIVVSGEDTNFQAIIIGIVIIVVLIPIGITCVFFILRERLQLPEKDEALLSLLHDRLSVDIPAKSPIEDGAQKVFIAPNNEFLQSYIVGVHWPAKERQQCSVIREFDKTVTLMATAKTVGVQDKQKRR